MAQSFPEMPSELRRFFPLSFWNWWQAFRSYLQANFFSQNDITVALKGKGLVLTNPAGTITKRIRLNDAGTDITIENV